MTRRDGFDAPPVWVARVTQPRHPSGGPITSHRRFSRRGSLLAIGLAAGISTACLSGDPAAVGPGEDADGLLTCTLQQDLVAYGGVPKDGIPSLTDPPFVAPDHEEAGYLASGDRVISLEVGGRHLAVPHNILWWHEVVNLNVGDVRLAVTYCPLTGSALVFDRKAAGGAEFGVSGLLLQNNLILYDRNTEESLWPQMQRRARCGPLDCTELPMVPAFEMQWGRWRELYPDGEVVSFRTRLPNDYGLYPYGDYERVDNDELLFPLLERMDPRRPPKERVLGIPRGVGGGGVAFPFGALDELGPLAAVNRTVGVDRVAVFWERRSRTAVAFRSMVGGQALTFEVREGRLVDRETGSEWRIDGRAVQGALAGERLQLMEEAYVAFWFAWAAFHLSTELWLPGG